MTGIELMGYAGAALLFMWTTDRLLDVITTRQKSQDEGEMMDLLEVVVMAAGGLGSIAAALAYNELRQLRQSIDDVKLNAAAMNKALVDILQRVVRLEEKHNSGRRSR